MLGGWERGHGACLALCSFLRVNCTLWLYPVLHRISSTACAPTSSTCTRSSSNITPVGWLIHGTVAGRVEGEGWLPRRLATLLDLSVCAIRCCTPPASRPKCGVTNCTLLSRRGDGSNDPLHKTENTSSLNAWLPTALACCIIPHRSCTLHPTPIECQIANTVERMQPRIKWPSMHPDMDPAA